MLSFHINAPLLTVPSVFAKRRSRRESKNGFPPISIFREKRSTIRKRAAKHFEGLAALSTHSTGRRAAVKAGCKPIHFSLDGCPLSCCFSGSVATTSGHFGAVDKVASENQQWEFEQKKRRSLASFRVPYQPLQVQSGR